jgi:hypothetical protein
VKEGRSSTKRDWRYTSVVGRELLGEHEKENAIIMAARMARSWSSTTKQVFNICRNSGVPDTAATTAAQRAVVASNSSRLTSSVSSPSRSFKSLFETRRPASVFFRYLPHLLHYLDNDEREESRDRERE